MRTKVTSLSIRSEKISAFKFALEYQKIDSYKRLELQTKELSGHSVVQLFIQFRGFVHSVSRSLVFAGEGFTFLVCSVAPPFTQFFLLFMSINML